MRFFLNSPPANFPESESVAVLRPDHWDDYGYKTQFLLEVYSRGGERPVRVGYVKILPRKFLTEDQRTLDVMPARFENLPQSQFCSLGQTAHYYRMLGALKYGLGKEVLRALNDICFFTDREQWWLAASGFSSSLLRTSSANLARRHAKSAFEGAIESYDRHTISFSKFQNALGAGPPLIEFQFDGTLVVPGRMNAVIGRNGVGKTSLLAGMAQWFGRPSPTSEFEYRPEFSKVVIASFNAHDTVFRGLGDAGNVEYVGCRPIGKALEDLVARVPELQAEPEEEWQKALLKVFPDPKALKEQVPRANAGFGENGLLRDLQSDLDWPKFLDSAFDEQWISSGLMENVHDALARMSAGQRVLVELYAALFHKSDLGTLFLVDEPENYLHPSLIARFVRSFNELLDQKSAFAVVATHSPIILQETPARFVRILQRIGDETSVSEPQFETFGESVESITQDLFETDFRSSHWKRILRNLADSGDTIEEIAQKVGDHPLSPLARSYVAFHKKLASR